MSFDKILARIRSLSYGLDNVDCVRVSKRVVQGVHDGVQTSVLDELAAETAAALASHHPEYARLAGRIAVSNLHKNTPEGMQASLSYLADDVSCFLAHNMDAVNSAIVWNRDLDYDYFGFKTLEKSYLLRDRATRKIFERPQTLLMRVAAGIHCGDLERTLESYSLMSQGYFTHATPTMFNAGTKHPTLASCFLLPISQDSIDGIYDTLRTCALISKNAGA